MTSGGHQGRLADAQAQDQGGDHQRAGGDQVDAAGKDEAGQPVMRHGGDRRRGDLHRHVDAEIAEEAQQVAAEADGQGRAGQAIFEHQQPGQPPGIDLAQGRIGVGVRGSRHRDAGGEFGVAQRGEAADDRRQDKRDNDRRAGEMRRGRAGHDVDARPDDAADPQHDQVAPSQAAAKAVLLRLEAGDRFA